MPYHHLNLHEREVISKMHFAGCSQAEIAKTLGRSKGTISRELNRNGECHDDHGPVQYNAWWSHQKARIRRHESRRNHPRKLRARSSLLGYVKEKLRQHWSPEQIAGRLRIDFTRKRPMRVSHQSIYRWIRDEKSRGGSYWRYLRCSRKKRRKRYGSSLTKLKIPGRISIRHRPSHIDDRRRLGHWEGDTMQGKNREGFLLTQVERKSGYLLIRKLTQCTSDEVVRATLSSFASIPPKYRQPMTFDNGTEFYRFTTIERRTGLTVYFADPYCSWQRGTNENTNGLIRQYFGKDQPLTGITHQAVARVQRMLNNRPRKRLNFRTPEEVLAISN